MNHILDNIYLGPLWSSFQGSVRRNGITHVLSIGVKPPDQVDGVEYHFFPNIEDEDESLIYEIFCDTNKIIQDFCESKMENKKLLIHCMAGVSRSATVLTAYLIRHREMTFESALRLVRDARFQVDPNPGFRKQLRLYEEEFK